MNLTGKHTLSESQVNFESNSQNPHEGQIASVTGDDEQTFIASQTISEKETMTPNDSLKNAFTEDHNCCESSGRPCQSSQSPSQNVASPSLMQEEAPEKQKLEVKRHKSFKSQDRPRPFLCTYENCGKSYFKASQLKEHMNTHTGEKPFICDVKWCKKKYTYSRDLYRHKKWHSKEHL
ncbi:Kruppel-like factor 18 [Erinaceus europaeus]|uniref:Kruppel-like factor 18 n=1 Tax=Erinaceus europaeus TaxID=9365 RepID=A0ABM3WM82_ERIEU|nr:Kruppel-like factor 18 [Erinaceus europaeus]